MLAGFTHAPAVELAERLLQLAPPGLNRCFYAYNGSSVVDVALKMSFHYWRNTGNTENTRIIPLENTYYCETPCAPSMVGASKYPYTYPPLLLQAIQAPSRASSPRCPGEHWANSTRLQFE